MFGGSSFVLLWAPRQGSCLAHRSVRELSVGRVGSMLGDRTGSTLGIWHAVLPLGGPKNSCLVLLRPKMAPGAYLPSIAARRLGSNTGSACSSVPLTISRALAPVAASWIPRVRDRSLGLCWWSSLRSKRWGYGLRCSCFPVGVGFLVVRTLLVRPSNGLDRGAVLIVTWWGMRAAWTSRRREVRTDRRRIVSTGETDIVAIPWDGPVENAEASRGRT